MYGELGFPAVCKTAAIAGGVRFPDAPRVVQAVSGTWSVVPWRWIVLVMRSQEGPAKAVQRVGLNHPLRTNGGLPEWEWATLER